MKDVIDTINSLEYAAGVLNKLTNQAVRLTIKTDGNMQGILTIHNFISFEKIFEDVEGLIIEGQVMYFNGINCFGKANQKLIEILQIEIFDNGVWDIKYKQIKKYETLKAHIAEIYNGSQAEFSRKQNVSPSQVTRWLNKKFIVVDKKMYSFRRELKL